MTDIPEDGADIATSVTLALADANLADRDIDAINAHGSSTPQNDVAEANAYRSVFGTRVSELPVTSIKSQIGHPLAASNAIETIASILSMQQGIIPPTINLDSLDPRCQLHVVANQALRMNQPIRHILKTSSGFFRHPLESYFEQDRSHL